MTCGLFLDPEWFETTTMVNIGWVIIGKCATILAINLYFLVEEQIPVWKSGIKVIRNLFKYTVKKDSRNGKKVQSLKSAKSAKSAKSTKSGKFERLRSSGGSGIVVEATPNLMKLKLSKPKVLNTWKRIIRPNFS